MKTSILKFTGSGLKNLNEVTGGKITRTTTQFNGGGNTPQGTANGVPIVTIFTNPTGKAPPGQNA
jgi:hypothetical protein